MSVVNASLATEDVEFLSYSGKYPNLCSGVLEMKIAGKKYVFGHSFLKRDPNVQFLPVFWQPGGHLDSDYMPHRAPWIIDAQALPKELRRYAHQIDEIFNANVPFGCCGGCA